MTNNLHLAIAIALALFIGFFLGIMVAQAYIIPRPQILMGCYNASNLTELTKIVRSIP